MSSTIIQLLHSNLRVSPDRPAILGCGGCALTYTGLLQQIETTVQQLYGVGVMRNDRVAVVLPNGPEMAVALLAVVSACACAPLNPTYRDEEFEFYLSDLDAKALVLLRSSDSPARKVAERLGIRVLELLPIDGAAADGATLAAARSSEKHRRCAAAEDIALVLHTSGTTARPKMVPLTHQNLTASAQHIRQTLQLTVADRCLNVMPLFHIHGFVGSVLAAIAGGGSIVCTPGFEAPQFFGWLAEFRPTWYTAVPTMHQAVLARAGGHEKVIAESPLRFIRSSSFALPPQVLAEMERVFRVPVIESYGMTEASHQVSSNPLPPGRNKAGSVGLPAGSEVAVMDEAGNFLPPGGVGEVVIRGPNVMEGYERNPEAHRQGHQAGWFRTGDQGYLDSEGYLFLTGRLKELINRGGEKISPREIDEVLLGHPAVAEAIAFPIPDVRLGEDVAAAVVLRVAGSACELELQEYAAGRIAGFKVPRRIVILDEIPKGPTGKPQRMSLAQRLGLTGVEASTHTNEARIDAPMTETEASLSELWKHVLGVDRVGTRDDFFQLGGDSILATQLLARLRERAGAELQFVRFFSEPTVAAVARWLEQVHRDAPGTPEASIGRRRTGGEDMASFAQERMYFLQQFGREKSLLSRPALFRVRGPLHVEALRESLNAIVQRHEVLRTTYHLTDTGLVTKTGPMQNLDVSILDFTHLPLAERETRAAETVRTETRRPFDLSQDLMLRAAVLRLDAQEYYLFLNMHHIASDGWSSGVLLRELAVLYSGCCGYPAVLPELPIQYTDFAAWQRQWLRGSVEAEQLSYWEKQLAGSPELLNLPVDWPRPAMRTYRAARESLVLPPELAESLKAVSSKARVTPFMAALAVFQTLLYRYTGQEDLVVGSVVAGRTRLETQSLIGLFMNTVALRTDLSGDPTFRELLARVRSVALEAYAHQDLPFAKVVEALNPRRSVNHESVFQVLFQFRNLPAGAARLHDLTLEELEVDRDTSNFDLAFEVEEVPSGLRCVALYSSEIFQAATIRRMLSHYRTILEAAAADPNQSIRTLPMLTVPERRTILKDWNRTEQAWPDAGLAELFETQVLTAPERTAVRPRGAEAPVRIPRRGSSDPCSLSFAQKSIWFLDKLAPHSPKYNVNEAFRWLGPLDRQALERAFNTVVVRHEILRTTYHEVAGKPVQVVAEQAVVKVDFADLRSLPAEQHETAVAGFIQRQAAQAFDLCQDVALRAALLQLGEQSFVLCISVHHIACDGWSFGLLHRELAEAYTAFCEQRAPALEALPIQYADYALWQLQNLQGKRLEDGLRYWRTQLASPPAPLSLSADPQARIQDFAAGTATLRLSASLLQALRAVSERSGATMFMVVAAALQTLLHRISGQQDILIGTVIACRDEPECERLVGPFMNTVVLRTDVSGNPSFLELLGRVRQAALGAFAHRDLPFARLVEALQPRRVPDQNPFFNVMLEFNDGDWATLTIDGVSVEPLLVDSPLARFALACHINEKPEGLHLRVIYQQAVFSAERMREVLQQFQILLEGIGRNPAAAISRLPLLQDAERRKLLEQCSPATSDRPQAACIHELFELQAERTPDAVAVRFEDSCLTYRELNRRANGLASYLCSAGVTSETLVGVCSERCPELVVAVLGVLKAGGAYVPLDLHAPPARLAALIEDAALSIVLATEKTAGKLPEGVHRVVCLDRDCGSIGEGGEENPRLESRPENLAYVIYTSGSTGQPKGVLIEHRALANYLNGVVDRLGLNRLQSFTMVQPLSVDAAVTLLYAPLLMGGCLHLISEARSLDARALSDYVRAHSIDCLKIAPSHLAALNSSLARPLMPRKKLILGGEAVRREWVLELQAAAPECEIVNHYGPTETTVAVTVYPVTDASKSMHSATLPIGRPLPNVSAYVLDEHLEPVPQGVAGELYLGGECLARGYLNRPEATAQAFIASPFGDGQPARLYRTGDLARYLPDGTLEFLGRRDSQVKLRGFRIEIGEIETAVARHPSVRAVAVSIEEAVSGGARLVAYVTTAGGTHLSLVELRSFLKGSLPDYMLPEALVLLDVLPRTAHGKLNRQELAALGRRQTLTEPHAPALGRPQVGPRDRVEAQLVRVWESILDVKPVGVTDSFFDLGGHSLMAVRLFSEMEKVFGRRLPLATLFEAPTIEQFARLVRDATWSPPWSSLVPIQTAGSKPPLFCVHGARGNVLFYAHLSRQLGPDQPFYALQARGLDGRAQPLKRIEEMAAAYIAEIRTVQPDGPYYLGGFCMGAYVALAMASQLREQNFEVALLASFNTDGNWKRIESLGEGVRYHRRNLSRLQPKRKAGYIASRLMYRSRRIASAFGRALCRLYGLAGASLPRRLRDFHVEEINRFAAERYVPRRYSGQVVYFQGSDDSFRDPRPFWSDFVGGDLEIQLVPGGGTSVFEEPNVQELTHRLKPYLGN